MRGPAFQPPESLSLFFARIFAVVVLVCGAALSVGCDTAVESPAAEAKDEPLPVARVAVLKVQPRSWPKIVRSQGSLVADEIAVIGAKVTGRVGKVHIDLGDPVRVGDPLATLDVEEFQLQLEQAEAQLVQARSSVGLRPGESLEDLDPEHAPPVRQEKALWDEAKANLARIKRLQSRSSVTQAELDQVEAAERVAEARCAAALNGVYEKLALIRVRQAEVSLARQRLKDAVVVAPFDGFVQRRQVAQGTYVQTGDEIATLVRTDPLRFRGALPERYAQQLKVGQSVRLRIESVAEPRAVEVTRISPALDERSRALLFEAELPNADRQLRTGLFAEAEITLDPDSESLVIPHSALVEFAGAEKVWKVDDGVAGEHEVLTGQRRPEGVEILRGLAIGDAILLQASEGRVARIDPLEAPGGGLGGAEELATNEERPADTTPDSAETPALSQ